MGQGSTQFASARGAAPDDIADEVFDRFPYGIVVVDAGGAVVATNEAACDVLGETDLDVAERTCCELFGCGERPLEGACLTRLALAGGEALPELRVDREASPFGAVWVTAAPLGDGGSRVLFHLRPGDPRDRRRRTTPHWTAPPRLRIRALGRTIVESAEGDIGGAWLQHRPGQLLKLLVAERRRMVHAEEIAESFWPGSDPGVLNNVRHFVHTLRERLEPGRERRSPSSFVLAGRGGYMLSRERVRIDADEFEEKMVAGLAVFDAGDDAIARRLLGEGLELYRGDFLADEPYAVWAFAERERLRDLAARGLSALGELALAGGDAEEALRHFRRVADMYPFDTAVQRRVIALYLREGRRSDAVRRYNELRVRMVREFGAGPEFQLAELASG